jgi:hypothetical protein
MLVLAFWIRTKSEDTTQLADVVLTYKVPVPIVSLPFQVVVISAAQMDFQNFKVPQMFCLIQAHYLFKNRNKVAESFHSRL